MKKKNESLLLFFASPIYHKRISNHMRAKEFGPVYKEYIEFCADKGFPRDVESFGKYYGMIYAMHYRKFEQNKKTAIRGKSMLHDNFFQEVGEKITPSKRVLDARVREVKGNIAGLDRRLLQMGVELARCRAEIKCLELKEQLRNKEEQIVGKVSVWKQCIPWCDDRPGVAYQDYLEWCKDRNLKPVSPHEFEKQMGDE